MQQKYEDAQKDIKKVKSSMQKSREKHEQRRSKGKKLRKSSSQATVILDGMKARSEKSQGKMSTMNDRILSDSQEKLNMPKEKIESPLLSPF